MNCRPVWPCCFVESGGGRVKPCFPLRAVQFNFTPSRAPTVIRQLSKLSSSALARVVDTHTAKSEDCAKKIPSLTNSQCFRSPKCPRVVPSRRQIFFSAAAAAKSKNEMEITLFVCPLPVRALMPSAGVGLRASQRAVIMWSVQFRDVMK